MESGESGLGLVLVLVLTIAFLVVNAETPFVVVDDKRAIKARLQNFILIIDLIGDNDLESLMFSN